MENNFELPEISVINSQMPVKLSEIKFNDSTKYFYISDGKISVIENSIKKYYTEICDGDVTSPFKIRDIYIGTVQIENNSNLTLYWIIYRHISSKINSDILFYNNTTKEFLKHKIQFNIHGLYTENNNVLQPSNLKNTLQIETPEIECLRCNAEEDPIFKLSRLFHNGTSNAIETLEISVSDNKIDTLNFDQNWMYEK
jgi:hypothetical protein